MLCRGHTLAQDTTSLLSTAEATVLSEARGVMLKSVLFESKEGHLKQKHLVNYPPRYFEMWQLSLLPIVFFPLKDKDRAQWLGSENYGDCTVCVYLSVFWTHKRTQAQAQTLALRIVSGPNMKSTICLKQNTRGLWHQFILFHLHLLHTAFILQFIYLFIPLSHFDSVFLSLSVFPSHKSVRRVAVFF